MCGKAYFVKWDMPQNRLAAEKSPYLRQHAHNPVDWYPWGKEAFEKAKREDKPLIVSIGYSTCHWCHVMERESFEDEAIAKIMNERFVCVKVDREERPDVDKIYMTAVQATTGRGGWPLNAFLTPEGKPFFGGTYFPPQARWGQPGWPDLLERIADLWKKQRRELEEDAGKLSRAIAAYAGGQADARAPKAEWLDRAAQAFEGMFDPENKGFGGAPKFPMPVNLSFLLRHHLRTKEPRSLELVVETLKAMAAGGIFDQVGGGFHRYSVDALWRVPHFEKMLYDNAQLASVCCEAYQLTGDEALADVARRTLEYLRRDLRHPEGAFYSAEDADSEGREGAFYVWTRAELEKLMGADFCERYGVAAEGNAPDDPHGELAGQNVLHDTRPGQPRPDMAKLLAVRAKRPRPGLDDKILASWNGLALSAFAKAAAALGDREYLKAAEAAARFLREKLYDEKSGRLWRRWRDGERAVPGTSDDYAFVAQGLLDLFEAGGEARWLEWALELTRAQQRLFAAPDGGLYMTAEDHDKRLLVRVIEDSDNVEPCASSVAASNLLRLGALTGDDGLAEQGRKIVERFGGQLEERPVSLAYMAGVVETLLMPSEELVIVASPEMAAAARRRFAPQRALLVMSEELKKTAPWLSAIPAEGPRAYLCKARACGKPVKDVAALEEALGSRRP